MLLQEALAKFHIWSWCVASRFWSGVPGDFERLRFFRFDAKRFNASFLLANPYLVSSAPACFSSTPPGIPSMLP